MFVVNILVYTTFKRVKIFQKNNDVSSCHMESQVFL